MANGSTECYRPQRPEVLRGKYARRHGAEIYDAIAPVMLEANIKNPNFLSKRLPKLIAERAGRDCEFLNKLIGVPHFPVNKHLLETLRRPMPSYWP